MLNTRRYPRSLAEAFPSLRAGCIETPEGTIMGYWTRTGSSAPIPTVPSWWQRLVRLFRRG